MRGIEGRSEIGAGGMRRAGTGIKMGINKVILDTSCCDTNSWLFASAGCPLSRIQGLKYL